MAIHVGQGETLIQFLVASAIKSMGDSQVREVLNAGGANLLGPLAELPRPLVALSPAAWRELGDLASVFPPLADVDHKAMTEAEAEAAFSQFFNRYLAFNNPGPGAGGANGKPPELAQLEHKPDFQALPDAGPLRDQLAKLGYDAKLLAAMPKPQVFLLDAMLRFRAQSDRLRLSQVLPPGHPMLAEGPKRPAGPANPASAVLTMAELLGPSIEKVRVAEERQSLDTLSLMFAESLRAALAEPGAEWGPKLLDSKWVKAMPTGVVKLEVRWDAERKAFTAPATIGRLFVWKRVR